MEKFSKFIVESSRNVDWKGTFDYDHSFKSSDAYLKKKGFRIYKTVPNGKIYFSKTHGFYVWTVKGTWTALASLDVIDPGTFGSIWADVVAEGKAKDLTRYLPIAEGKPITHRPARRKGTEDRTFAPLTQGIDKIPAAIFYKIHPKIQNVVIGYEEGIGGFLFSTTTKINEKGLAHIKKSFKSGGAQKLGTTKNGDKTAYVYGVDLP